MVMTLCIPLSLNFLDNTDYSTMKLNKSENDFETNIYVSSSTRQPTVTIFCHTLYSGIQEGKVMVYIEHLFNNSH